MRRVTDLCHELAGNPSGPVLVVIQGLAQQLIDWPRALIAPLARDHRLILPDNRDAGLSPKFGPCRSTDPGEASAYALTDMAADIVALLDRLDIERAHLVGHSMGGAIAQIVAAEHPGRVLSLACLMSSGGQARVEASPELMAALGAERPADLLAAPDIALFVRQASLFDGAAFAASPEEHRARIVPAVARCYCPLGTMRQMEAVDRAGDRRDALRRIACPTLIVHGSADPVIPVENAREGAALVPGARLHIVEGMGHNLSETSAAAVLPPLLAFLRAQA
jgi:pimeloyl-ACP methyl ester carboxylesterase